MHDEFVHSSVANEDQIEVELGSPDVAMLPGIPVGFCQLRSEVGPMRQKELSNILQGALAAYGQYNKDEKEQVSVIAAQLLHVMTQGEGSGMTAVTRGGMSVQAPSKTMAASAHKERLKPQRERQSIQKNKN